MRSALLIVGLLTAGWVVANAAQHRAAQGPVAIIDLNSGAEGALLLGGWDGKRWVKDEAFHRSVKGGEKYRFYSLVRAQGDAIGSKPRLSEASGSAYQITVKQPPTGRNDLIGVTGAWNAMARPVKLLSNDLPEYRTAVDAVLKQKKLTGAQAYITRIARVDLEGDGTDEVLISATCRRLARDTGEALYSAKKGDYSFVLLRKLSGAKVMTQVLDGGFYPKSSNEVTVNVYSVGGVLDLNGDGVMEVVVRSQYYEGGGASVFEVRGGRARKVLEAIDGA
jgi:hypothetical protein